MSLDLSALSTREALTAVYIGYYDRAADAAGMQFWEAVVANTSLDLTAITTDCAGQSETQAVHPFFADPDNSSAATFITSLYQNLFNRDPDDEGLAFWTAALEAAVAGAEGAISVGEIIISIIQGAVDVEGGTQDRTTILNKIEVGVAFTDAAEADGGDYDDEQEATAKSIIEGITEDGATVTAAKASIDDFFAPAPVPGEEFLLTSATDVMTGTDNADEFNAYMQQNPFAGGVSNSLSSADRLDGGAGDDRLYAEVIEEFSGVDSDDDNDIQPRLSNIEEIDLEAREGQGTTVEVDGKNITDHVEIGSYYSDADLYIENLTTLTSSGSARNTSEITVTMDHTDNFNSDDDASDLVVLFDNDYLLSGEVRVGTADFFLLDQDAELRILRGQAAEGRLDEIDKNGIRFSIDGGTPVAIEFDGALLAENAANEINDHDAFIAALQQPLQDAIDAGLVPAGTQIVRFDYPTVIFDDDGLALNRAGLQDGSFSDLIPSVRVISGDGSPVEPLGFTAPDEITGEFNVFGRFDDFADQTAEPISIDIDIEKAGRGGEGGDLVIGGKAQNTPDPNGGIADGIEVFNISVKGIGGESALAKPSNLGTITSTGNELETINIVTDPAFVDGDSYASLIVRNGFDQDGDSDIESGDLKLVNANGFLGNLVLGDIDANMNAGRITNLDTLTALGGGNVEFNALLDGNEVNQAYTYTTGSGADIVRVEMAGDALDYAGSSVNINTGSGNDVVSATFAFDPEAPTTAPADPGANNQLNQAVLDNVLIDTGDGNDTITVDSVGVANILAGVGNDTIYSDGAGEDVVVTPATTTTAAVTAPAPNTIWALNFDNARADATTGNIGAFTADDLPGVQTSLAYLGGATVTVTLSGAQLGLTPSGQGGVMADANSGDGAVAFGDGYESRVTITDLINGNSYYGDQRDVNAAVVRAINDHPVLGKLLEASIASNNTVVVVSKTSGAFAPTDLRIDIAQAASTSEAYANAVTAEARSVFSDSSIAATDLFDAGAGTLADATADPYQSTAPGALTTSTLANAFYDGLSVAGDANSAVDNRHTNGTADVTENDNVIDGGAGDDVIVLSTDILEDATIPAFTVSSNNALINGASNETIVLTGNNFGNDVVMNFTTAGGFTAGTTTGAAEVANDGMDFLDFTAYLTSQMDVSTTTAGTGPDSFVPIAVTLDTASTASVTANEVVVLTYTESSTNTFENLSASDVAALFNNSGTTTNDYGTLNDDDFSVVTTSSATDVVGGAAKAIVMIENANNDGDYRVFELSWNSAGSPATVDHTVTVTQLGDLDFGDSLEGLLEANLVGSADYANILEFGLT